MADPTTGCAADEGGVLRCRATGKRCLSYRQAAERAHAARRRGERVDAYHCRGCGWWHFGHGPGPAGKPRRPRGGGRAWRRAMRNL